MNGAVRYRSRDMALIAERARSFGAPFAPVGPGRFLPLDEPSYAVLRSLAGGPFAAHDVARILGEIVDESLHLSPPALKAALGRLIELGLVADGSAERGAAADPGPRSYGRTALGEAVMVAESGRRRRAAPPELGDFLAAGRMRIA